MLLVVVMTLIAIFKIKKWTKKVFREDDEEDNFELDSSSNGKMQNIFPYNDKFLVVR